jgi:hypothetical protein
VFERINRLGVKLDTLQLLSAWSWSDEFDLQEQFEEMADEVSPFGFRALGEDSDLLLRCCAAIISRDASPSSIIALKGSDVRSRFREIRTGIKGAIDFLRTDLHVYSASVLPFTTLLIPLSVFFATDRDQSTHPTAAQREQLVRWIWRTFFTRRYSKRLEQLNQDIKEVDALRAGQPSGLGQFPAGVDGSFFTDGAFNTRTVDTKTFILMLAAAGPLDFVSGGRVALDAVLRDCNKKEFHHLYPRAYLKGRGVREGRIDALINFAILPRATNNRFSDQKPSDYRTLMPGSHAQEAAILAAALCPPALFADDYDQFVDQRLPLLVSHAKSLMGV